MILHSKCLKPFNKYKWMSFNLFKIKLLTKYWHRNNTHTHTHTHMYVYIIIIMSCRLLGYPWSSLATSPYRSSPPAGLQDDIPYVRADRPAFLGPYMGVHRNTYIARSILVYIYSHPQTDLFRSIRTHQCG